MPPVRKSDTTNGGDDDAQRDAIILPDQERRLADARASANLPAIARAEKAYTEAREDALKQQREDAKQEDDD